MSNIIPQNPLIVVELMNEKNPLSAACLVAAPPGVGPGHGSVPDAPARLREKRSGSLAVVPDAPANAVLDAPGGAFLKRGD